MSTTKILLKIDLQGVLGDKSGILEIIPYSYNTDVEGNEIPEVRGNMKHKNKNIIPCSKHVKISEVTYNYFISSDCPHWVKEDAWKSMNELERVNSHCARIAEGNPYSIEVLD